MPLLMKRFDPRLLVVAGTLLFALSCFINVSLTHDVGMDQLILPQLLRAAGQPLFTVPLSQMSTAGLQPRDTADASALSNMMRNLGGSIGIAMLSTMIDRREHMHFSVLAEAMTRNATLTQSRLAAMTHAMQAHVVDPIAAQTQALGLIASQGAARGLRHGLQRRLLDHRGGAGSQPRSHPTLEKATEGSWTDRSSLIWLRPERPLSLGP